MNELASPPVLAAFVLVVAGGAALTIALLKPYAASRSNGQVDLGVFSWRQLILASTLGLYLELLLIRWISSEIRIFAYFKNFVLIACFLGFGLGCYLGRRAVSVLAFAAPLVFLAFVVEFPWPPLRYLVRVLPLLLGATSEMQIWGVSSAQPVIDLVLAAIVTLPLFALLAITFIPIGQLVGRYLEIAPRGIAAYSVNVLASLAGIALYSAVAFLSQPPIVWFALAALLAIALFWSMLRSRVIVTASMVFCLLLLATGGRDAPGPTFWSPYQKLTIAPMRLGKEIVGYQLWTNASWYQRIINLSPQFVQSHPQLFRQVPVELNAFNLAYRFAPHPRSVLILGAGMGSDAAAALRNGAERVTAVDIDPLIVDFGRELHPEHPYSSPRVHVVVDDARSFLANTQERFDVIVFAALDSHTTISTFSNIRIDNYVYTLQALQAARRLLTPDGVLILRFSIERPWIAGRLHDLVRDAMGQEPIFVEGESDVYATGGSFFVAGNRDRIAPAFRDARFASYVRAHATRTMEHVEVATDDWPYLYQRERGLPASVAAISILLLAVSLVAARRVGLTFRSLRLEFFLLGAGFMLLEAQIISRMALLFGTTWVVNSIVIATLLLLIVAANGVAAIAPRLRAEVAYVGIVIAIAAACVVPLQVFFFRSFALKAILGTLFLSLPVFFAGIVFIKRFAAAGFAAEAIGSNLLGSLAGGIAESLSLLTGLRSLLVLAAVLYVGAWSCKRLQSQ